MIILKQRQTVNGGGTPKAKRGSPRKRTAWDTRSQSKKKGTTSRSTSSRASAPARLRRSNKKVPSRRSTSKRVSAPARLGHDRHVRLFDLIKKKQKEDLKVDSIKSKLFMNTRGMAVKERLRTESEKKKLQWFETGDKHCDEAVKNAIIQEDKKYQDEITALDWPSWAKKAALSDLKGDLLRRATVAGKKTWYQCKDMKSPLPRTERLRQWHNTIRYDPNKRYYRALMNSDGTIERDQKGHEIIDGYVVIGEDRSSGNPYANKRPAVETGSKTKSIPTQQQQEPQKDSYKGGFIKNKTPRKTKRKTAKRRK